MASMSNPSFSKEREQQTNEKVDLIAENPQLEPARLPPPPPPLNPPSSSSLLPPTAHDPSLTSIISSASSGDLVASQIAQLFSLVGRLSSENEALQTQIEVHSTQLDDHSSSIARLSAENEELKRGKEESHKTMEEMSKAFGSHWVGEAGGREGGEEKGRWRWSVEKRRQAVTQVPRSKPPPSLDSIPVELFDIIASLLPRSDKLRLCAVTFSFLQRIAPSFYGGNVLMGYAQVSKFVANRVVDGTVSNDRIGPLLLPQRVVVQGRNLSADNITLLQTRSSTLPPIPLVSLELQDNELNANTTSHFLRHLDPYRLAIGTDDQDSVPPSHITSEADIRSFALNWTRLRKVACAGIGSVPLLAGSALFAFSETLARCSPLDSEETIRLVSNLDDGSVKERELESEGSDLANFLFTASGEDLGTSVEISDSALKVDRLRTTSEVRERRGKRARAEGEEGGASTGM